MTSNRIICVRMVESRPEILSDFAAAWTVASHWLSWILPYAFIYTWSHVIMILKIESQKCTNSDPSHSLYSQIELMVTSCYNPPKYMQISLE